MKSYTFCISAVLTFMSFVKHASSIMCYDCNSLFDPRCGPEFDPYSLGVINCSLKDPLDHMPDAVPSVCRTIKMDIQGKIRVVRQCGYLTDEKRDTPCYRQSGTGDVFTTYCTCNTDLCNAVDGRVASVGLLTSTISLFFGVWLFGVENWFHVIA